MFSIIKNGVTLTTINTPTYIRLHENGSFALCPEEMAQGIVVDGKVYHIFGKPPLEGKEDIILQEIDETSYYYRKDKRDESLAADLDAMSIDHEERILMLELGVE